MSREPQIPLSELKKHPPFSVEPAIFDTVVPIFCADHVMGQMRAVGSGVFVKIGSEYFLLTAAHVSDEPSASQYLAIPAGENVRQIKGGFAQIGEAGKRTTHSARVDAAYWHLDPAFAREVEANHRPVEWEEVDYDDSPLFQEFYTLAGYPAASAIVADDSCSAEFFAFTGMMPHERFYRKLDYDPNVQVMVKYNTRRNIFVRGTATQTPEPWGMSGGAIFAWPKGDELMRPDRPLKLVGITTEWRRDHAIFAGTKIGVFLGMIHLNNPGLLPPR